MLRRQRSWCCASNELEVESGVQYGNGEFFPLLPLFHRCRGGHVIDLCSVWFGHGKAKAMGMIIDDDEEHRVNLEHWLLPLIAWTFFCILTPEKPPRGKGCTRNLTDPNINHSILFSTRKSVPLPAPSIHFERFAWLAVSDDDFETLGDGAVKATGQGGLYSIFNLHADKWLAVARIMRKAVWMQIIAGNRKLAYVQSAGDLQTQTATQWACHQLPYRSAYRLVPLTLITPALRKIWYDVDELTKATNNRTNMSSICNNITRLCFSRSKTWCPDTTRTQLPCAAQLLQYTRGDLRLLREDTKPPRKRPSILPAESSAPTAYTRTLLEESSPSVEEQACAIWYEISQFWKQFYDEEDLLEEKEGPASREWHVSKYPAERFWGNSLKRLQIGIQAQKRKPLLMNNKSFSGEHDNPPTQAQHRDAIMLKLITSRLHADQVHCMPPIQLMSSTLITPDFRSDTGLRTTRDRCPNLGQIDSESHAKSDALLLHAGHHNSFVITYALGFCTGAWHLIHVSFGQKVRALQDMSVTQVSTRLKLPATARNPIGLPQEAAIPRHISLACISFASHERSPNLYDICKSAFALRIKNENIWYENHDAFNKSGSLCCPVPRLFRKFRIHNRQWTANMEKWILPAVRSPGHTGLTTLVVPLSGQWALPQPYSQSYTTRETSFIVFWQSIPWNSLSRSREPGAYATLPHRTINPYQPWTTFGERQQTPYIGLGLLRTTPDVFVLHTKKDMAFTKQIVVKAERCEIMPDDIPMSKRGHCIPWMFSGLTLCIVPKYASLFSDLELLFNAILI
ncbi:uncharacterized protein MYCFIDRAFT_180454 [Pseudocercospora fijiensis CIRAD86]|uniref:Uncharacterized protein n=1 Tax=Pseudocercospora fijiensis (strain CIRAD86) TaxID=383855 RepID=M2YGN5_PSEFD|nr:uncharacterized protein MYCFIDRAFT_180454 [Pseudocercospora fijiensis CIRAD86]EME76970.1 hypothetical protein MYCFIDRAFT_180454 [Pseudocercospora fijiensis CIRAD86]